MLKDNLVNFLNENNLDYLLVNSTNEFLVEYNELEQNARYYLTGFTGSTGEALINKNGEIWLFVDGRYHKQADIQAYSYVNVVKLALGESFLSNMVQKLDENSRLGIVSKKIALKTYRNFQKAFENKNINIIPLESDPIFNFTEQKTSKTADIIDIPEEITGQNSEEKISYFQSKLDDNCAILITNLEQIAWLLNKRAFAQNFSSSFKARMIIEKNAVKVFYEQDAEKYYAYLKEAAKKILYSTKTLSYYDYSLIQNKSEAMQNDEIEKAKAIKNNAELKHLQSCFDRTDIVVTKTANYVNTAKSLSEQELVKFVEKEFFAQGATSLSFNTILASGKNSALAHYATDMNETTVINKGDFVLLDCGAYFEGGYSTDITRVFCFGEPNDEAKKVYTTVLKANLNAYHIEITDKLSGYDIDKKARDIISNSDLKGYNFNHGTGHGVGISVHEFPPSISISELAKTPLEDGMVFTIEPGAYNPEFGGVRLENTVFFKNGKLQSFSKVRFEEKLINYDMLNETELKWLQEWQSEALQLWK